MWLLGKTLEQMAEIFGDEVDTHDVLSSSDAHEKLDHDHEKAWALCTATESATMIVMCPIMYYRVKSPLAMNELDTMP